MGGAAIGATAGLVLSGAAIPILAGSGISAGVGWWAGKKVEKKANKNMEHIQFNDGKWRIILSKN